MFAAYASEAAESAHATPYLLDPKFWVSMGFIIFVALIGKRAYRIVTFALDQRAERIQSRIEEADRLAAEAEALLAQYRAKQEEAAAEAQAIVENAKREVARMAAQAEVDLDRSMRRREQMAADRIAQAEASAVAEVRARAVDIAMAATEALLAQRAQGPQGDALIDQAIADLSHKLH